MKLRVPPGCGAASHDGRALDIDAQGCVEVEENVALALAAHGFAAADDMDAVRHIPQQPRCAASPTEQRDAPEAGIGQLNRRELFAFLKARGVGVRLPITNEELRVLARSSLAKGC